MQRLRAVAPGGEPWEQRREAVLTSRGCLLPLVTMLPRRELRTRRLTRQWLALGEDRFCYRLDSQIQAEEQAWQLMRRLPERGCTQRAMWELHDARTEARHVLTKTTTPARPRRWVSSFCPLADQDELLRPIDGELATIRMGALLGAGWRYRRAVQTLDPWLREIQEKLADPWPVAELEEITAQWRTRRARLFDDDDPADVIVVERPGR
jgi:hypothetical protein